MALFTAIPSGSKCQLIEDNYNRAYVYAQKRMYQDAIKEYEYALSKNPDKEMETRIRFNLSVVYNNLDMKEDSLKQLLRALELNPGLFVLHLNIAHAYKGLEKYQEAILEFKKALEIDSNYSEVYLIYYNLGHIYNKIGNYEQAVQNIEKALSLKPDHIGSLQQMAYACIELKRFDQAEQILNNLENLNQPQKELFDKLKKAKSQN